MNILGEYSHPDNQQPKFKCWYKIKRHEKEGAEKLTEAAGRVKYSENINNHHILTILKLKKNDSAEYTFTAQTEEKKFDFLEPGVTLLVTGKNFNETYEFLYRRLFT